jgi:anhydro-N-acetylmuramic acid kinase
MPELYIGLMSGTSLDGVDGVLIDFGGAPAGGEILAHAHVPFDIGLRNELLALNTRASDELARAALTANALAERYADAVGRLLDGGITRAAVTAVGAHGQTVRHQPKARDGIGFTVQLNNPARLAELCGIDVVADFRSRDIAAGGQGAPLVPAYHRAAFASPGETVAVVNLGGISNLTVLADDMTIGFDCGPGNALLDYWCERHTGNAYDTDGRWAACGQVIVPLLEAMLGTAYFAMPPPKSTGRDLFNASWLAPFVARHAATAEPDDVQATLAELTAVTVARATHAYAGRARDLWVCGGGAFNAHLLQRLAALAAPLRVRSTAELGMAPTQVEAAAFAWLARRFVQRLPGNLSSVTGAAGPRVLGALYPA